MNVACRQVRARLTLVCQWFLLALATAGAVRAEERAYKVRPSDTLFGIARAHGLTLSELTVRNGLDRDRPLYAGQILIIPDNSADVPGPTAKTASPALGSSLQRAINRAPVSPGRWKYIVIHHSGVDEGSLKSIDRYHREERHMENGLAYHFLIGNGNGMGDGEIAVGNRWKEQLDGGHLRSEEQNKIALGICLVGNFDNHRPSEKQMRSLENLIRALMQRCKLGPSAVKTHQQINIVKTECPGSRFPTSSFLERLKKPGK